MRTFKKQQGMATILLVLLIGITVMLITATVARALTTKKEAATAAHAQTNAQIMGWAGVSAFREYLFERAKINISNIPELRGRSISLQTEENTQQVVVKNIEVLGCLAQGSPCTVSADISANNLSSQAATTIRAIYNIVLTEGTVPTINQESVISFGGNTVFSGSTLIESESPNAKLTMNVEGSLTLNLLFETKNISELNINATDDVYIDCGYRNCGEALINVTTRGKVTLLTGDNFGNIRALGTVSLQTGAIAKNIQSIGDITLSGNSKADNLETMGNVTLSWASVKDVKANGWVSMNTSAKAGKIESNKDVTLWTGSQAQDIYAKNEVELHTNTSANNIKAGGNVLVTGAGARAKNIETLGTVELWLGGKTGDIIAKRNVEVHTGSNAGNIQSASKVSVTGAGASSGSIYTTGNDVEVSWLGTSGPIFKRQTQLSPYFNSLLAPQVSINETGIRKGINDSTQFQNKVDVTVYKQDANYIFTRNGKFDRVFLNQLKNRSNTLTYIYENNSQYIMKADGTKEVINSTGFSIGDYTLNGQTYTGAICQTITSGRCTSPIIGYLPRISVGKTLGIDDDYGYGEVLKRWRVRSLSTPSSIDNATLAPGIMYFEGTLEFAGEANWRADSLTNAYTNSFLAEGEIWSIAFSPRIYAPYQVVREGADKISLICNRKLKTVSKLDLNIAATTPTTLSDRYLMPINLCKNDNQFLYAMDKNPDGSKKKVTIDGRPIDKLDLGTVALMANEQIHIGACSRIYGSVLSRKGVTTSKGCGLTNNQNAITGTISTQGVDGGLIANHIMGGTNIVLPATNKSEPDGGSGTGLKAESAQLRWARYL
ncbi:DUF342 domain-containing protein [Acinetobacter schindleri]|uniref:DUF342 domain-containing protein n=1 Tax=Acinetobacter schindleri TaxID=108981 RepID=UPI0013B0A6A3|nr:DUF342 domain-containing protein [Acinetobacter schindleri]QIC64965.1 DUF342 domain-containing protein [Acinetobacter schindleri]